MAKLLTLWVCRHHPDTALTAKLIAALVVAYVFSPIDLIPDFIPGYLDDLLIVLVWAAVAYWAWILIVDTLPRRPGAAMRRRTRCHRFALRIT